MFLSITFTGDSGDFKFGGGIRFAFGLNYFLPPFWHQQVKEERQAIPLRIGSH